jgi:acyl-CoA thioesterase
MAYDLDKIREFFKRDRYATQTGIVIDCVSEEEVICSLELTDMHKNAGGGVQGGAIFTLADLSFAVHSNLEMVNDSGTGITVGQSYHMSFFKATRGKKLFASSICQSKGRVISVYKITVTDDLGVVIAEMIGNAYTTMKPVSR